MNKKKIAFMVPETKWWAYYVYKEVVEWLKEKYWNELDIYFFNTKKDWLKLHFAKYDIIFSVIPFLFKPIRTKKFIYILVWNYLEERKKNRLWNKLLYLTPYNFKFSNSIILMNNYLLIKISTLQKYKNKIKIIPNFIDFKEFKDIREYNIWKIKDEIKDYNRLNILTVTWFKFFDKARWVINLKKVISNLSKKYSDKKIIWNIVWNSENDIYYKVLEDFNKIKTPDNLEINWLWWINKEELLRQYKNNDIFLYWTYLDVFPTTLLESSAAWLPIFVNNFESFKEIIPNEIISNTENNMIDKIINFNLKIIQKILIENAKKFDKNIIIGQFIKLINNNEK